MSNPAPPKKKPTTGETIPETHPQHTQKKRRKRRKGRRLMRRSFLQTSALRVALTGANQKCSSVGADGRRWKHLHRNRPCLCFTSTGTSVPQVTFSLHFYLSVFWATSSGLFFIIFIVCLVFFLSCFASVSLPDGFLYLSLVLEREFLAPQERYVGGPGATPTWGGVPAGQTPPLRPAAGCHGVSAENAL